MPKSSYSPNGDVTVQVELYMQKIKDPYHAKFELGHGLCILEWDLGPRL